ncbi:MAG: ornithine carbamoyltransferase [Gammaproteobacteria bacterium]|jgi:ornithine carbamoyltransferase|nr:ornithine carbamoyltransferase [Gammaproteobacteria bacterium]MBQ0775406.1 ornithine carbamoyltransferase [Gammaproteobacteria bacterium]
MSVRHFLTLLDLSPAELNRLIQRAIELKAMHRSGKRHDIMRGKTLGMIFEKSSTRTRVSFEAGMTHFGGASIFLSPRDTQLGRGEPIEDSARVLSRMVDIVMIRTFAHQTIETFSAYSAVPVINALTDDFHPCQLLADMQTYVEHRGSIQGKKVVWVGDGNNMCNSYINAARQFDFELVVSCPEGFEPNAELLSRESSRVSIERDPLAAAHNAHLVVTDVWASMGQEDEQKQREKAFANYQVNNQLMALADKQALFMHCLPAHRGEEVSAELMDAKDSVVWDEAENRLHAQKALLEFLMFGEQH